MDAEGNQFATNEGASTSGESSNSIVVSEGNRFATNEGASTSGESSSNNIVVSEGNRFATNEGASTSGESSSNNIVVSEGNRFATNEGASTSGESSSNNIVVLSDDDWSIFDDLPDLEVPSGADVRIVSSTPTKRRVVSKKRKASGEGHKGKGKKLRMASSLKNFTFFHSLVSAALYFLNDIIVKRMGKGHCDNRNDIGKLLRAADAVDVVMPKSKYFDENPEDEVIISELMSYDSQKSVSSDVNSNQFNKMGTPSLSIFSNNHLLSFEEAGSISFLQSNSDLVKMLGYSWQGTPANTVLPDGESCNSFFL